MSNPSPFKWRHVEAEIIRLVRALVPEVFAQLSWPGRDDARTGTAGGSHHALALGRAAVPGNSTTAVGLTSKRALLPGEWMNPPSTSKERGRPSSELSTPMGTPSSFS